MNPRAVVVGNPVLDEVRHDGIFVRHVSGGTATYASLALRTLGLEVSLVGTVGAEHVALLRGPLEAAGVDVSRLRVEGRGSTSYCLDYRGRERHVRRLAAGPRIEAADVGPLPAGTAFVHVGPVAGEVALEAIEALARQGVPLGIDLHALRTFDDRGTVGLASAAASGLPFGLFDTIKGALPEVRAFAPAAASLGAALNTIAALGVRHVLATDGARGAVARCDGVEHFVPAFAVREVDATGAGDVFLAAFSCARHVLSAAATDALAFAAAAASFVVEGPGASTLGSFDAVRRRQEVLCVRELDPESRR